MSFVAIMPGRYISTASRRSGVPVRFSRKPNQTILLSICGCVACSAPSGGLCVATHIHGRQKPLTVSVGGFFCSPLGAVAAHSLLEIGRQSRPNATKPLSFCCVRSGQGFENSFPFKVSFPRQSLYAGHAISSSFIFCLKKIFTFL